MKTNKDLIYDYIKALTDTVPSISFQGVSTQQLSDELGIQRPNVSSLLNKMIEEGLIEKSVGRPVLYKLKEEKEKEGSFSHLIGFEGSLKNAIESAKAVILYPKMNLNALIIGGEGTGKSFFEKAMIHFALENSVISSLDATYRIDCKTMVDNEETLHNMIFNIEDENCLFNLYKSGIVFIDSIEYLSSDGRKRLLELVSTNTLNDSKGNVHPIESLIICGLNDTIHQLFSDNIKSKMSIHIQLPNMERRPLQERKQFIRKFVDEESVKIEKEMRISYDLMKCLLLYKCDANVRQLRNDIRLGCAKAYVREYGSDKDFLNLIVSDFPIYVRRGILNYKRNQNEIEELLKNYQGSYSDYEPNGIPIDEKISFYNHIDEKISGLKSRGFSDVDINSIISVEIEGEFQKYSESLSENIVDIEQLSKVVRRDVIDSVTKFLKEAEIRFQKKYTASVFYGLCLHISSMLERKASNQSMSNQLIADICKSYPQEYAFCLEYCVELETNNQLNIPIDEVVFITMFICDTNGEQASQDKSVILYAMHGDNAATSIANTVRELAKADFVYGFDMSLDEDYDHAYQRLLEQVISIHRGKGVVLIYDMGSFKDMAEMISLETGIEIAVHEVPITLIGLDCVRKTMLSNDVYSITSNLSNSITRESETKRKVIVTLCYSGDGGAKRVQEYIQEFISEDECLVIPLAISDKKNLLKQLNTIQKKYQILYVVGMFNPEIYSIPFLAFESLFSMSPYDARRLLLGLVSNEKKIDMEPVFDFLSLNLKHISVEKIRGPLTNCVKNLRQHYQFDQDTYLGLFMHLSSAVNRLSGLEEMPVYANAQTIIERYEQDYRKVKKELKQLEKEFDIYFEEQEIAGIISIIKRL